MLGFKKIFQTPLWRCDEAAALTGGENTRAWSASGIAIAQEDITPGDLFFAAHGDDLALAFKRGAAAAVIPHTMKVDPKWSCLKVLNTYEALRLFAAAARHRSSAKVIAVQGDKTKRNIEQALSKTSETYSGGTHVSSSLAAIPEDVSYGVFGMSPMVAPDIVVITNPQKAQMSRVFSAMSPDGIVVIENMHHTDTPACMAAIRAAGVQTILTPEDILSGHAKLKDKTLARALTLIAQQLTSTISLIEPDQFTALKVRQLIDFGCSNKTLIMESLAIRAAAQKLTHDIHMPQTAASYRLVCTSKHLSTAPSLRAILKDEARYKEVSPEVLTPGDLLVFKKPQSTSKMLLSKALRFAG